MQTTVKRDIPKRSRYYQGMIDLDLINRGAKFNELKKSYVIFICLSDPFSEGRHIYSFENICVENPDIKLSDETYKIFLNADGRMDDVSESLLDFFELIRTGNGHTVLAKKILEEVEKARTHDEWRREFMTLYMRDQEKFDEGMAVGLETGMAKGRKDAQIEMARKLIQKGQTKEYILTLGITEAEYEDATQTLKG